MNFFYALLFGAGLTAGAYAKLGKRVGYGNHQNIVTLLAVIFVISTIVFFTLLTTFFKS